jgi:UMF1 family MFS transporter
MTPQRRAVWSWALYDWANSAFATTIVAGFFPVFYGSFWRQGSEEGVSTAELGFANTAASLAVAVLAPLLGTLADHQAGRRIAFLGLFTALGVVASGLLGFLPKEAAFLALLTFILGNIGFNGSLAFYDALLTDVAEEKDYSRTSSLGFGLGYLGGGLLFVLNVAMLLKPELFGISSKEAAVQASFVTVALWWALFSVPVFLFVKERPGAACTEMSLGAGLRRGIGEIFATLRDLPRHRPVGLFLLAYVLYIDGVNTVIRMATKYGQDLGFEASVLMTALLMTQFIAFPAALAFGWIGTRIGAQRGILLGLSVYVIATIGASQMTESWHFYVLAAMVGLVQGGVQSLSRSHFASLVPAEKAGQFFGLYNILGKAAAILGPTLMGVTALLVPDARYSILSVPLLFIAGGAVLWRSRQ